ncbi:MAG TPA: porin family protein [Bacteroidia bacterium]|uniref:porin family protein n=1 Tax=Candidatus Pollutiaquabacter sp. TaxID=3416354 RepID=UPI002C9468DF|nr:PorT family protein [Bacteroidota bacterium]HPD53323.1 porin family protein [Bacteroidia bacterium]HRS37783.1 porin family protein [Bacteroidia bacterium]
MKSFLLACITSIALLLGTSYKTVSAQNTSSPSIGIKGGLNYSSLNFSFTAWDKPKTGYHLGAFVNLPLSDRFSIQPELLYSTKGTRVPYRITDWLDGQVALDLRYLDLPVMGQVKLGRFAHIEAGPYASLLLDANLKHGSTIPFLNFSYDLPNDVFSRLDYGLAAGAGMDLGHFGVGVRYNYGLGKVEDVKQLLGTDFTITNARNTTWQLSVTYRF